MIRQKMPHSLQPSIRAASLSSSGMVRKNWRMRKMLNALPKNAGTHSGLSVPIQPSVLNTPYIGTMSTGNGTIIVTSVSTNRVSRPRQRTRAKP